MAGGDELLTEALSGRLASPLISTEAGEVLIKSVAFRVALAVGAADTVDMLQRVAAEIADAMK